MITPLTISDFLDGAYAVAKGIPSFKAYLTRADVEAIRAYIVPE